MVKIYLLRIGIIFHSKLLPQLMIFGYYPILIQIRIRFCQAWIANLVSELYSYFYEWYSYLYEYLEEEKILCSVYILELPYIIWLLVSDSLFG